MLLSVAFVSELVFPVVFGDGELSKLTVMLFVPGCVAEEPEAVELDSDTFSENR